MRAGSFLPLAGCSQEKRRSPAALSHSPPFCERNNPPTRFLLKSEFHDLPFFLKEPLFSQKHQKTPKPYKLRLRGVAES